MSEAPALPAGSRNWQLLEKRPGGARPWAVAIVNQKGGVGKTTTAVNLGAALAERGHRILLLDLDPQANATTGLGLDRGAGRSTYDLVAGGATALGAVRPTGVDRLDCIPADADLAGIDIELAHTDGRERRLEGALAPARGAYDLVLIDCPPSLGLLTVNALVAAQDAIVPVQCEYYALEGLGQLLVTAERIRRALNPGLRVAGFVMTMFDARTKLAGEVVAEVRNHFGDRVFETVVPRTVRLSEAPSFGEPVLTLDPMSKGAAAYRMLAREVERRYGLKLNLTSSNDEREQVPARPGPGGRGYGVLTPIPAGLSDAWPPPSPWGDGR